MTHDSTDTVQDLHHPLILSSRVVGTEVYDRAGNKLGTVDDLSIEKKSGKTVYAILSFGGFLGIGERYHPVPWSMLEYDVEREGYVVPIKSETLNDAPHYDASEIRMLGGADYRAYGDTIYGYYGNYGVVPYW